MLPAAKQMQAKIHYFLYARAQYFALNHFNFNFQFCAKPGFSFLLILLDCSHHKQELAPGLQHLVEQGHCGWHVGHPVQAGEGGDQGEGGGIVCYEGGTLC